MAQVEYDDKRQLTTHFEKRTIQRVDGEDRRNRKGEAGREEELSVSEG